MLEWILQMLSPSSSTQHLPPFSCNVSPDFASLLTELKASLAISTYQAGKVIFIGVNAQGQLTQLPRNYNKAMGIAIDGHKMAVATKETVEVLAHSEGLALSHPHKPGAYSSLYVPRATYYTGFVDIHDLEWGKAGLWAVNTSFSCLCLIEDDYSFTPQWQPYFIQDLEHDDYCHLNGLAMDHGEPAYVTALGESHTPKGWKPRITEGGVLMDVPSNSVISHNLAMPHSPRIWDGKLYVLLSASGKLVTIDRQSGHMETVCELGSFVRGMTRVGDYVFIGRSRLRESSTTFQKLQALPVGQNSHHAGITAVHLPSGRILGELNYLNAVEEIYDVQVLAGLPNPGILNTETPLHTFALSTPRQSYWANPNHTEQPR